MTEIDGLAALAEKLSRKRSGWHWWDGLDGLAIFPSVPNYPSNSPEQRKLERDWEQRALDLLEAQEIIQLEAKPEENTLAERKREILRGD